jgi:hypothetical protein
MYSTVVANFMYYVTVAAKSVRSWWGMLVGWKSFVISRNLRLYGLKFGKLSASAEDFLT